MSEEKKVLVKFIALCRPYNPGETAAFPPKQAKDLVKRKAAIYVHPTDKKKATKIADRLPEGVRHNGGGWFELPDHVDPETEKPYVIKGEKNALDKLEELLEDADEGDDE